MRLFVAVPLPAEVKDDLGKLVDDWRKSGDKVNWVNKENLHFTLKFLGKTPLDKLAGLKSGLSNQLHGEIAFNISLAGAGAFPNWERARVLWIGVSEGKEKLGGLAQKVESGTRSLGFPADERGFSAHLTLGRMKDSQLSNGLSSKLRTCSFVAKDIIVSEVVLFQSELAPGGSIYTPLEHFGLVQ